MITSNAAILMSLEDRLVLARIGSRPIRAFDDLYPPHIVWFCFDRVLVVPAKGIGAPTARSSRTPAGAAPLGFRRAMRPTGRARRP